MKASTDNCWLRLVATCTTVRRVGALASLKLVADALLVFTIAMMKVYDRLHSSNKNEA